MSNKNLSNHFLPGFANSDSSSPGSTAPRRPPRSKHDLALSPANGCSPVSPCMERKQSQNDEAHKAQINHVTLPSKEAHSRLLIGTQMLQGTQNNKHVAATATSYQSQTALKNNQNLGYFEPEKGNASWVVGSTTPQEVSSDFKNDPLCKSFRVLLPNKDSNSLLISLFIAGNTKSSTFTC